MKILFNEKSLVNRQNMRFIGYYIKDDGDIGEYELTLDDVKKAVILTAEEVLNQGYDCVESDEYLQIELLNGDIITWDNAKASLRQAL